MATFPKISDNEMNYFQFKARQLLLLKKENQEWQEYCEQVAPVCTECSNERITSQSSKNIGIQVSPQKPIRDITKQSFSTKCKKNELPEALNNIRIKLENIDLALSKMYDSSGENNKEKEYKADVNLNGDTFEKRRKLLIQNSLKASLQKINSVSPVKPVKASIDIKRKKSGFFLPHDLQVKRIGSRKAYLASLQSPQTKSKTIVSTAPYISKKNVQSNFINKNISKCISKPRKKAISKSKHQKSNMEEETLIKSIEVDEDKDDNIEYAVDGILDNLLGEAAMDLNRMRQMRTNRKMNNSYLKTMFPGIDRKPETLFSSSINNTIPKTLACDESSHLIKLKQFLDSLENFPKINYDTRKEYETNFKKSSQNEITKQVDDENGNSLVKVSQCFNPYKIKTMPKFVCDISHIIYLNPIKAREISSYRRRFWKYLRNISRTVKGSFNPWIFCNVIVESILDDCIQDIADELTNVPSTFIKDLYNQEFIQQVQHH